VIESLRKRGLLTTTELALTLKGAAEAKRLLKRHPHRIPQLVVPRIHVGPLATGSALQKSDRIWKDLPKDLRLVRGLDMEGAVIGFVAGR